MKLPLYKYLYAAFDFAVIFITQIIAAFFVNIYKHPMINDYATHFADIPVALYIFFFVVSFVLVFIFQSNNLYKLHICLSKANQIVAISKSLFYGLIFVIVYSFFIKSGFILESRLFILCFGILALINFSIIRVLIIRWVIIRLYKDKIIKKNVLIIGAGKAGKFLATKLHLEDDNGISILGFLDDKIKKGVEILPNLYNLGNTDEIEEVNSNKKINEVIIAIDNITYERLLQIIDKCQAINARISLSSSLFDIISEKMVTEQYSEIPIIEVSPRVNEGINIFFKRVVDFIGALVGLVLLSPLLFIIAVIIKLTSKGPVLFTHDRVGKDGKYFKFYKFRSMTVVKDDDEERKKMMLEFMKNDKHQADNDTKIINNSRVTKIGKLIRKTSIDELPQLINVIKGEMSLVGPRPALPYEYEHYDNWQKRRVKVLPGCTGLWQISGRSNVNFNDSVVLDLFYINNMSPWLDLQIILKTIPVMLFAKGGK